MRIFVLSMFVFCLLVACKQSLVIIANNNSVEKKLEPTIPEGTEIWEPIPLTVIPSKNNQPPSDAIVLFDGSNFNEWEHEKDARPVEWILNKDGSTTIKNESGNIQTKKKFGCVQLHIEWRSSSEIRGNGQSRSNSGVYLQKQYELQVLDNNDNKTYVNGQVGAIYKQSVPLVKASVPTGEWNTYDVVFHAPEFNSEGLKTKSATITVLHNGILIQDHFEIKGTSQHVGWPKNPPHGKEPLMLQDHLDNSGVSYRNIWIRELH